MLNKINFLTAGESHGQGLMGIIQGIPSNLEIDKQYINYHLSRRQKGFGRGARMKIEKDSAKIYCGIRNGKTIGAPIGLIIPNLDWKNWDNIMNVDKHQKSGKTITLPRPGHADLAGIMKYQFDDIRNVIERSSARETTMRVALGTICRKFLEELDIHIASYVTKINTVADHNIYDFPIHTINKRSDKSEIRCLDKKIEKQMINTIKQAQKNGDTVGGKFQVLVSGAPYGLGSYIAWDKKLNAKLAESICSINAIKTITFGRDSSSDNYGSELHDEIFYNNNHFTRSTNNAGGIEGGMSNAQHITISATMKPLSTLSQPLQSVDIKNKKSKMAHKERTDTCAVPAAAVIAESMVAIVLADSILDKFGGDSMQELKQHFKSAQF